MITLVRILVLVPGVLFLVTGLRWLLAPPTEAWHGTPRARRAARGER